MMFIPNAHCWNDNDSLMKTAIFSYFESFLALSDYRFGVAFGCMEKCKMYRNISCLLFTIEQLFGSPIFQTVFPLPQQQQRHNVHAFTLRFGRAHWMARRRWSDKAICQHFFVVSSNGRREERDSRERKKTLKTLFYWLLSIVAHRQNVSASLVSGCVYGAVREWDRRQIRLETAQKKNPPRYAETH